MDRFLKGDAAVAHPPSSSGSRSLAVATWARQREARAEACGQSTDGGSGSAAAPFAHLDARRRRDWHHAFAGQATCLKPASAACPAGPQRKRDNSAERKGGIPGTHTIAEALFGAATGRCSETSPEVGICVECLSWISHTNQALIGISGMYADPIQLVSILVDSVYANVHSSPNRPVASGAGDRPK